MIIKHYMQFPTGDITMHETIPRHRVFHARFSFDAIVLVVRPNINHIFNTCGVETCSVT